jgi:hypothetical protein
VTAPDDEPKWVPPLSFVAIGLLVGIITFFHPWSPYPLLPFALVGQLCMILLILRAFAYWPPTVRLVRGMAMPHRLVFGVLLGAMLLGHYTIRGPGYFPFIVWEIFPFVREDDPVTCDEFIATTANGAKVRLLVEQLFPSIVQVNPVGNFPPGTTEHLAHALARTYNVHHPDNPVRQVNLMRMAVQLHPPANESRAQPSCELLNSYDISSDR